MIRRHQVGHRGDGSRHADNGGATTASQAVTVNVAVAPVVENIAPSVTIVKPSSGSSFVLSKTPTTITIEAAASDPDAPVRIQVKRK